VDWTGSISFCSLLYAWSSSERLSSEEFRNSYYFDDGLQYYEYVFSHHPTTFLLLLGVHVLKILPLDSLSLQPFEIVDEDDWRNGFQSTFTTVSPGERSLTTHCKVVLNFVESVLSAVHVTNGVLRTVHTVHCTTI